MEEEEVKERVAKLVMLNMVVGEVVRQRVAKLVVVLSLVLLLEEPVVVEVLLVNRAVLGVNIP